MFQNRLGAASETISPLSPHPPAATDASWLDPEGFNVDFDAASALSDDLPLEMRLRLLDKNVFGPEVRGGDGGAAGLKVCRLEQGGDGGTGGCWARMCFGQGPDAFVHINTAACTCAS